MTKPSSKLSKKDSTEGPNNENDSDLAILQPILKKLNAEERKLVMFTIEKYHSGPLPSPETLSEYDAVLPGLAQTIVDAFKGETAHRHTIDTKIVDAKIKFTGRGQSYGLLIFFSSIVIGGFFTWLGHETFGCSLIGAGIGTLAVAYVANIFKEKK